MTQPRSPVTVSTDRLPAGVTIRPRRYEFRDLDAVPQHWFAGNAILSHLENAFSILIPPGELFFIRSVKHYEGRVRDPELRDQVRAFTQQEGHHTRAHQVLNASFSRFGVDVEREVAYAERAIDRLERWLPARMRLGATVFLEHLTATGAHLLFSEPAVGRAMHPEMLRFWRWHAAEELEHKAVAFDVYRAVGGGYLLRVASAIAAIAILALPFDRITRRMLRQDRLPITGDVKAQARAMNRLVMGKQLRMIGQYFRPGFHPWNLDDTPQLAEWYAEAGATRP